MSNFDKLYEYTESYRNLARLIEDNPELSNEELIEALQNIQESSEQKISNTAEFVVKLKNDIALISERIEELKKYKTTLQNKVDNISNYVLNNMVDMNMKKVNTGTRIISIRNNQPKLHVTNTTRVPEQFKTYETVLSIPEKNFPKKYQKNILKSEEKIDKRELLKTVKALRDEGKEEEYKGFAALEENKTLSIK